MYLLLRILILFALILSAVFIFTLSYAVCVDHFKKFKKIKKENAIIAAQKSTEKIKKENAIIAAQKSTEKIKEDYWKKAMVWYKNFVILHKSIISIVLFIGIMIGFPLALQNNWMDISRDLKNCIKIGTTRDWFGFWSSYIGSIMAIAFAYFNTKLQIKNRSYRKDANLIFKLKEYTNKYFENTMIDDLYSIIHVLDENADDDPNESNLYKCVFSFWDNFNKYIEFYWNKSGNVSYSTYKKLNRIMNEYLKIKQDLDNCLQCQIGGKASDSNECKSEIDESLNYFEILMQRLNDLYDYLRIRS